MARGSDECDEFKDQLRDMVRAARNVVNNWSQGDLAGAVNELEAAANDAEELLK